MNHLTAEQTEALRQRLEIAKVEIAELLAQTEINARPVDLDLPIGRLSRMDAMQMQGMAQKNKHLLDIRRQQVDVALAAFEQGTYGLCRSCKGAIGVGRLEFLPESPFCLECQDMFEREARQRS